MMHIESKPTMLLWVLRFQNASGRQGDDRYSRIELRFFEGQRPCPVVYYTHDRMDAIAAVGEQVFRNTRQVGGEKVLLLYMPGNFVCIGREEKTHRVIVSSTR